MPRTLRCPKRDCRSAKLVLEQLARGVVAVLVEGRLEFPGEPLIPYGVRARCQECGREWGLARVRSLAEISFPSDG